MLPSFSASAQKIAATKSAPHFKHNSMMKFSYAKRFQGIRAPQRFLIIKTKQDVLIITPKRFWCRLDGSQSSGSTAEMEIDAFHHDEFSSERANWEVVGQTWEHTKIDGERDHRYKDNPIGYLLRRYGIEIALPDGTDWQIWPLTEVAQRNVIAPFLGLIGADVAEHANKMRSDETRNGRNASTEEGEGDEADKENSAFSDTEREEPTDDIDDEKAWYEILGVSPDAAADQIRTAYHEKLKAYHPDLVERAGPEIRELAERKTKELNSAYAAARDR
jgi:hypothetical protein